MQKSTLEINLKATEKIKNEFTQINPEKHTFETFKAGDFVKGFSLETAFYKDLGTSSFLYLKGNTFTTVTGYVAKGESGLNLQDEYILGADISKAIRNLHPDTEVKFAKNEDKIIILAILGEFNFGYVQYVFSNDKKTLERLAEVSQFSQSSQTIEFDFLPMKNYPKIANFQCLTFDKDVKYSYFDEYNRRAVIESTDERTADNLKHLRILDTVSHTKLYAQLEQPLTLYLGTSANHIEVVKSLFGVKKQAVKIKMQLEFLDEETKSSYKVKFTYGNASYLFVTPVSVRQF